MSDPAPDTAPRTRSRHRAFQMIAWGVAILLGLGAGAWVSRQYTQRERAEGLRVATEAAELTAAARKADSAGDRPAAVTLLQQAVHALEQADPGTTGNAYATVLADLAGLYLRDATDRHSRGQGRRLLERAWHTDGVGDPLRARIARDLGAASLLEDDLPGARQWYRKAATLDPGNPELETRLTALPTSGQDETDAR